MSATDKLPCGYCGRSLEVVALVAIPNPAGGAKLACPLCAAQEATR